MHPNIKRLKFSMYRLCSLTVVFPLLIYPKGYIAMICVALTMTPVCL